MFIDLIVAVRNEVGIWKGVFGSYRLTIVAEVLQFVALQIMVSEREMGTDVEQLNHLVGYLHVEIKEKLVFLLKERAQVVLVVRKEWTLAIG